jgi:AcrR family transcriptional regulator
VTVEAGAPDRRATLKARYRRAILDAANALIAERGGPQFSVDELAERADVSRRTVFNHFASINDVVVTAATETLETVIDGFYAATAATPVGGGTRAEMFDEIAQMLRAADLSTAVAVLCRALGGMDDGTDPRQKQFVVEAFSRAADHLAGELSRRNPEADRLDIELLVTSLVHGVGVIAQHWITTTTDMTGPAALAAWDGLLDRLITSVRAGYMPEH